jgi:hypothetical protein
MIVRTLALVVLLPLTAHAADSSYCRVYANRMSAMTLQRLVGVPFVNVATGRFLYRQAWTSCLNSDEEPEIVLSETQQPLIDGMPTPPMRPEGSVPATDPADAPAEVPVAPVAPKAKATKTASTDQPLCVRHHMRTVYHGLHWNCRK